MLVQMEDSKFGIMKTTSNISESVKADVLERFGATLFEIQDHFQDAMFSKDLSDDEQGDTLRLAQKKYALEHATVRRLRSKLREKEKLLMSLQKAIEAACESALDQQNKDRKEIECLHGVLSMKDDQSLQEIKYALKDLIKQKPEVAKGLAGDLANLLEEKLSDLFTSHEGKVEELQASLDCWKKRCQALEAQIQAGERKHEQQIVLKDASTQELQLVQPSPRRSNAFMEKLKLRLSVKECKVKQLVDRIKELEVQLARTLESQVDINLQRSVSQNYERSRRKAIYLEDLVSKLKQEVHQLKNVTSSGSNQLATESLKVKRLQKDLDNERNRAQALALELAQQKSKGWDGKNPCFASEKHEPEVKIENLKGVVNELTAKICKLQNTYQKLSSNYQGVRASSGTSEVFDEFCLTHSARDLDTKEVHLKLMGKIRNLQRKLTQCQEDLKVNDINKQFFEEKLNSMEERALKAELRLACEEKNLRKVVEPQVSNTACHEIEHLQKPKLVPTKPKRLGPKTPKDNEPELFELTQVLNYNDKGSNFRSCEEQNDMRLGQMLENQGDESEVRRHFVFANDSIILELNLTKEVAQCKLLSKRKLTITTNGDTISMDKYHIGSQSPARQGANLEALVENLKKDLEHMCCENGILKNTRPSNMKYMNLLRKNKEVTQALREIQEKMVQATKVDPYIELTSMQEVLTSMRASLTRWSGNSPWVQALVKLNACCENIGNKLSSTFLSPINETNLKPSRMKENMFGSKAMSQASKDSLVNDSALAIKLEEQAKQLRDLQTELSQKIQAITNLNIQLDRRDNELHLMHGHTTFANENRDNTIELHQFQTDVNAFAARRAIKLHCCEHLRDIEILLRENIMLKTRIEASGDPKLLEDKDLKLELCEVYKICSNYEQMLHKYTKQHGIPFKPLHL